jgi:hypothetical protein
VSSKVDKKKRFSGFLSLSMMATVSGRRSSRGDRTKAAGVAIITSGDLSRLRETVGKKATGEIASQRSNAASRRELAKTRAVCLFVFLLF